MLAEATQLAARGDVLAALKQASAATGSDFHYLLCTAMRESSLHPQAKSATSSACGLFQFVEQTWFGLVKQYGAKHGLGSFANAVSETADGHFEVADASDRHAVLALRSDPQISALMAGEYANETRASLESSLGRSVSNGELYAAHFLGAQSASRLIRMNSAEPQSAAASAFPEAAAANHSVFYHTDGTAKTIREVYNWALKQPAVPSQTQAPEIIAQQPQPKAGSAGYPDEWTAVQLWAALQPSSPSLLSSPSLPQAPFAATPDILDILGAMADPQKTPALRTKLE